MVVFQCFLADDHVPAAGDRRHHKINWTRVRQLEFDRVLVACVDLADRLEQYAARDADALRRFDDPVEGRLHVVSRQFGPVVKLNVIAQHEGVGLAVLGDLPAMRQIGDNGLAAVARVTPDQVVEHAPHRTEVEEGARLMEVKMRRPYWNAHAHDATVFGVGLGRLELKFGAVEFQG